MPRGAFDYLSKACTPDQVRQVLARFEKIQKPECRVAEPESQEPEYGPLLFPLSCRRYYERSVDILHRMFFSTLFTDLCG